MPGKDFDLEAELDEALGPSPVASKRPVAQPEQHDLEVELDSVLGPSAPPPTKKSSKVIEMPVQSIVAGEADPKPAPKPWYSRFVPNTTALLHGAGAGATANFGEEGAAALSTAASKLLGPKDPEGFTREYKAGSQYADMRDTLENENNQLRAENPGSFIAGEMLGSAPAAIAAGGAVGNIATPVLRGGMGLGKAAAATTEAALAGGLLGSAAGAGHDVQNRARGAAVGGATGAATGAAMQGLASGLDATARNAANKADEVITQTFMTPAQRAVYEQQHGLDSIRELGKNARGAGLFKGWRPTTAAKVAKNANKVMSESGEKITGFEDDLAKAGIDPDVNIRPIVEELRGSAAKLPKRVRGVDTIKNPMLEQADMLEQPEPVSVAGKNERPPALPEKYLETYQNPPPAVYPEKPAAPEQLPLPTPRTMPSKQLELNLPARNRLAYSPEPAQLQMDLPRQQPSTQLDLPLEPQQAKLPLPPAEAPKMRQNIAPAAPEQVPAAAPQTRVMSGGATQEPLFGVTDPARPQAPAVNVPGPAAPEQVPLYLPDRQMPLPLDVTRRPNRFVPAERPATQMNLPVQQELPLPAPAQKPTPAPTPEEIAAKEAAELGLDRGPQPELSTPLEENHPQNAQVVDETIPFSEAANNKRLLGKQIDWGNNPRTQQSDTDLGTNTTRKITWKGIAQQIDAALKGDSRIDPAKLSEYNQAKKHFSTAATAFDPSVKMMERQNEVGMGARDLMAGAAFGAGNPITGGLMSMAHKKGAGWTPAASSGILRGYGKTAGGLSPLLRGAAKVSPVAVAREQNPNASESEVKQEANKQVKKDLDVLLNKRREPR